MTVCVCVCAVCALSHTFSPNNNHIVRAYIYGDTVIKLKQEHVVVAQIKWYKKWLYTLRMRVKMIRCAL